MPLKPTRFDAGYAIESTCHAPDKEHAFAEIFRVLKPGALFWGQEMCMTEKFDPDNSHHLAVKDELMLGIALKDIATFSEVNRALEAVGFQIIEAANRDIKDGPSVPWYQPMEGQGRGIAQCNFGGLHWVARRWSVPCGWQRRSGSFRRVPRLLSN